MVVYWQMDGVQQQAYGRRMGTPLFRPFQYNDRTLRQAFRIATEVDLVLRDIHEDVQSARTHNVAHKK